MAVSSTTTKTRIRAAPRSRPERWGSPLTGDIGGLSATLSVQGSNLVLTAVPEPSTWVLTVLGASALLAIGRGRVRRGGRSTATPTQRLDG